MFGMGCLSRKYGILCSKEDASNSGLSAKELEFLQDGDEDFPSDDYGVRWLYSKFSGTRELLEPSVGIVSPSVDQVHADRMEGLIAQNAYPLHPPVGIPSTSMDGVGRRCR